MKRYPGYKEGLNSRGFVSGSLADEKPDVTANEMAQDPNFKEICNRATKRIQELKAVSDVEALSCADVVEPTSRQARRYRNKHGSAYKYGRG